MAKGFLFDDIDNKASSLNEYRALLLDYPEMISRVKPYLGW